MTAFDIDDSQHLCKCAPSKCFVGVNLAIRRITCLSGSSTYEHDLRTQERMGQVTRLSRIINLSQAELGKVCGPWYLPGKQLV